MFSILPEIACDSIVFVHIISTRRRTSWFLNVFFKVNILKIKKKCVNILNSIQFFLKILTEQLVYGQPSPTTSNDKHLVLTIHISNEFFNWNSLETNTYRVPKKKKDVKNLSWIYLSFVFSENLCISNIIDFSFPFFYVSFPLPSIYYDMR